MKESGIGPRSKRGWDILENVGTRKKVGQETEGSVTGGRSDERMIVEVG